MEIKDTETPLKTVSVCTLDAPDQMHRVMLSDT